MIGNQYLLMLNEDEAFKFRFNFFRYRLKDEVFESEWSDYMENYYDSFGEFISNGFVFTATPEGHDYWNFVRDSMRDGIKYEAGKGMFSKILEEILSKVEKVSNKNNEESLDDILKELNIKKQKSKMTKLELIINPFLCKIDVSAKINGVEERGEIHYVPLDYPCEYYVSLGESVFKVLLDYDDTFYVDVFDEENISCPFKTKITK